MSLRPRLCTHTQNTLHLQTTMRGHVTSTGHLLASIMHNNILIVAGRCVHNMAPAAALAAASPPTAVTRGLLGHAECLLQRINTAAHMGAQLTAAVAQLANSLARRLAVPNSLLFARVCNIATTVCEPSNPRLQQGTPLSMTHRQRADAGWAK